MVHYIDKSALVEEIARQKAQWRICKSSEAKYRREMLDDISSFLDTLDVKEVDINKLCEFRKNIGFAYPEGASEYQKQLACYRQGIKDAIKAQKGEL